MPHILIIKQITEVLKVLVRIERIHIQEPLKTVGGTYWVLQVALKLLLSILSERPVPLVVLSPFCTYKNRTRAAQCCPWMTVTASQLSSLLAPRRETIPYPPDNHSLSEFPRNWWWTKIWILFWEEHQKQLLKVQWAPTSLSALSTLLLLLISRVSFPLTWAPQLVWNKSFMLGSGGIEGELWYIRRTRGVELKPGFQSLPGWVVTCPLYAYL